MEKVFSIIDKLKTLSGNEQLNYLKSNKDNLILKEVLQYTYNPDLKFKINEAKLDKGLQSLVTTADIKTSDIEAMDINLWNEYKKSLDELVNKKGVTEQDVARLCRKYFLHREKKSFELLKGVLLKDLRINMNVKLFLKVWNDFCNDLQVQLANKFTGKEFKNPFYSRKFDGKRMYIMNGKPYSRTNKICSIPPISHILEQLNGVLNIDKIVLDGECLYFDKDGKEDFQKGISLTSKDERTSECENICYVIFDIIPKDCFINKTPSVEFNIEYSRILNVFADETKTSPCYSLIPTKLNNIYIARQDRDMGKLSELRDKNNWEGLMVRDGDKSYEYKRTNNLLKIKAMKDDEFNIVGFFEGSGRLKGTLGGITIKLPTGENVDVGSGYSDDDRKYIWDNQELILKSGYQAKVQYFEETKDKKGNNSLRFPVFKAFRKDNVETMRIS